MLKRKNVQNTKVNISLLTLSRSTSVINIPNSEHIHASDKYILSFISVRSFANKKGLSFKLSRVVCGEDILTVEFVSFHYLPLAT